MKAHSDHIGPSDFRELIFSRTKRVGLNQHHKIPARSDPKTNIQTDGNVSAPLFANFVNDSKTKVKTDVALTGRIILFFLWTITSNIFLRPTERRTQDEKHDSDDRETELFQGFTK